MMGISWMSRTLNSEMFDRVGLHGKKAFIVEVQLIKTIHAIWMKGLKDKITFETRKIECPSKHYKGRLKRFLTVCNMTKKLKNTCP